MIRMWVIRHGESENNQKKLWSGWQDVPLTEKGKQQAGRAGESLLGIDFDKVYSSDLSRARETASLALPGMAIEEDPLLREINVGRLAGMPSDVITLEEKALGARLGYGAYGGESREEFAQRINKFVQSLDLTQPCNLAVFSHSGWLRGFLSQVMKMQGLPGGLICRNCAMGVFEYDKGAWKLHSWINLP